MSIPFQNRQEAKTFYQTALRGKGGEELRMEVRKLCRYDLFFLLVFMLKRGDIDRDWLFDRGKEVQNEPDGCLDLWAREHYKSTIITFGKTIQDILVDPEVTVGIFSHTRPIAKGFLRQIKHEFEQNKELIGVFPDILWENPKQAPKWSEDDGIIVKRKTNPKEATVEAWGLVDGQPVSKHFNILVFDDVVTLASVNTPEMINKTTAAWEMALNLGVAEEGRVRYIGTRYHGNDTYQTIIDRGSAKVRRYPGTLNGKADGEPVLFSKKVLAKKFTDMGPYTFACQILQDPRQNRIDGFDPSWLQFWKPDNLRNLNIIIIVDPANEKKKTNDYTAMWVLGLGSDKNWYGIDMVRDRLNLTERTDALFELHRKYNPKGVFYEKYGMQADIQHIEYVQAEKNYRFRITEFGGNVSKIDRIKTLTPLFKEGRLYLPETCFKVNYEGRREDLVQIFIKQEYKAFPISSHDDMLDCLARITDSQVNILAPIDNLSALKARELYEKYAPPAGS